MNPKASRCRQLAALFEKAIAKYPAGKLDMDEARVKLDQESARQEARSPHTCGTVHCHGGWAAIMLIPTASMRMRKVVDYQDGAGYMTDFLFGRSDSGIDLEAWARKNPELWGNRLGAHMFSDRRAFEHPNKRPAGAMKLQHIADHWREVGERIAEAEKCHQSK